MTMTVTEIENILSHRDLFTAEKVMRSIMSQETEEGRKDAAIKGLTECWCNARYAMIYHRFAENNPKREELAQLYILAVGSSISLILDMFGTIGGTLTEVKTIFGDYTDTENVSTADTSMSDVAYNLKIGKDTKYNEMYLALRIYKDVRSE